MKNIEDNNQISYTYSFSQDQYELARKEIKRYNTINRIMTILVLPAILLTALDFMVQLSFQTYLIIILGYFLLRYFTKIRQILRSIKKCNSVDNSFELKILDNDLQIKKSKSCYENKMNRIFIIETGNFYYLIDRMRDYFVIPKAININRELIKDRIFSTKNNWYKIYGIIVILLFSLKIWITLLNYFNDITNITWEIEEYYSLYDNPKYQTATKIRFYTKLSEFWDTDLPENLKTFEKDPLNSVDRNFASIKYRFEPFQTIRITGRSLDKKQSIYIPDKRTLKYKLVKDNLIIFEKVGKKKVFELKMKPSP